MLCLLSMALFNVSDCSQSHRSSIRIFPIQPTVARLPGGPIAFRITLETDIRGRVDDAQTIFINHLNSCWHGELIRWSESLYSLNYSSSIGCGFLIMLLLMKIILMMSGKIDICCRRPIKPIHSSKFHSNSRGDCLSFT